MNKKTIFPVIETELNDDQREIVEHSGNNLLVSAGAGSGKTRVLIEKLMKLIKSGTRVSTLLVTTFTREAGNQMLAKLSKALADEIMNYEKCIDKLLAEPVQDDELRDYIEEIKDKQIYMMDQLEELSQASIGTLHTFCEKLIKKYFYAVKIDVTGNERYASEGISYLPLEPTFKIIEEKDADFFKNQVLDELFEDYNQKQDKEFLTIIEIFKKKRSIVSFKKELVNLLSFIKSKKGYINFLSEIADNMEKQQSWVEKIFNDYLKEKHDILKKVIQYFLRESEMIGSEKLINYCNNILNELCNMSENKTFFENYSSYKNARKKVLPRGKLSNEEEYLKQEISLFNSGIRKKYLSLDEFDEIGEIETALWFSDINVHKKLIEILSKFDENYKLLKLDKNYLDFNDLEEYTLKILEDEYLRKTIQNKFSYILVDEYQDINEIQENILTKISDGKNMIMVGDVKQSIYGFRNTSPEIFLKKYDEFSDGNGGDMKDLKINYRSQKPILDYCNYLFGEVMTIGTSNIDYKVKHSFKAGTNNGIDSSSVEFHIINTETKKTDEQYPVYSINNETIESRDYQLDLLIKVLRDTLKKNIYDDELKQYRKCCEKDICILCRKNGVISEISKIFTELKIPFSAKYNINLYTEEEINLVLSFLQLIHNDYDDISLLVCLTSYIYNVTNDELVMIKKEFPEEDNFYKSVLQYAQKEDLLAKKIQVLYNDINELRKFYNTVSLRELVEIIYNKFSIIPYYSMKKDGEVRVKNLQTYLTTLESGLYTQNLTTYLNYINGFAINDKFNIFVNGGENSIKIQTIHASKGLEYNVVILYDVGNYREENYSILKDRDLGIALYNVDIEENTQSETLSHIAFKINKRKKEHREEMRLLYVALTRAKNKLIVIGNTNLQNLKSFDKDYEGIYNFAELRDIQVMKTNNYLALMLGVLDKYKIEKLSEDFNTVKVKYDGSEFSFTSYMEEDIPPVIENKTEIKQSKDDFCYTKFSEILNYKYYDTDGINTRLKNTVTALQEEDTSDTEFFTIKYGDNDQDNEITPLELGNSYHLVMKESNLDINNIDKIRNMPEYKNVDENRIIKCIDTISKISSGRKIYAEKMFLMYLNKSLIDEKYTDKKILVQGIVDLVLEGDDDLILIDYKTTKGSLNTLKSKYAMQLKLYSIAAENHFHKPVKKKYIYSFHNNKLIESE